MRIAPMKLFGIQLKLVHHIATANADKIGVYFSILKCFHPTTPLRDILDPKLIDDGIAVMKAAGIGFKIDPVKGPMLVYPDGSYIATSKYMEDAKKFQDTCTE